jgi:DNA-binding MarR family transcriptional regulator
MQERSIGKTISIIYRLHQRILNRKLNDFQLGSGQYLFFLGIIKNEGITQKGLSEILSIDKATTAKAVKKLLALDYVQRKKDSRDSRLYHLYLTETGQKIVKMIYPVLDEITQISSRTLSAEEEELLFSLLEKVKTNSEDYLNSKQRSKEE